MKLIYDAGIRLYGCGARLAALRSPKARIFVKGRKTALAELERLTAERAPEGYDYWFHAASLGEFEQARPLIEKIKKEKPEAKILLSFFSPSGYNVRRNYDLATAVIYLPADTHAGARRFLEIARPRATVFVKYEFWLNFIDALEARGIPTFLISAIFRPSQSFFKWWGATFRKRLAAYRTIYVQDEPSARLLETIGVKQVRVTGDTRFDRVHDIMVGGATFPAIEAWTKGHKTLIVGSSWPQDEDRYLDWVNTHPDVRVIIAPHEFDEARIASLRHRLKNGSAIWTEIDIDSPNALNGNVQVLIVNTFGKLSSLYRYADFVIVGGGFGAGIHNINEAAVYGVPVIFGPNNRKFKEAADLKMLGGGFEYRTSDDVNRILDGFLNDSESLKRASQSAAKYIADNLGATDIIYNDLKNI